jgi:outer membrane protein assembly factor BamD
VLKNIRGAALFATAVFAALSLQACVSDHETTLTGSVANFDNANLYFTQGKFDSSQRYYAKVNDEAPDSPYRAHALLGQADSYYLQGEFIVAAPLYARFVELYPLDQRTSNAFFYEGMSYFQDMVDVKKDQTSTQKALERFEKFIEKYPDHPASPFAKEKLALLTDRMAEKVFTIAKYYYDLTDYGSCIGRVDDLLKKYPDSRLKGEALMMKAKSYAGEEAYEKAKTVYLQIIAEHPGTDFSKQAETELNFLK